MALSVLLSKSSKMATSQLPAIVLKSSREKNCDYGLTFFGRSTNKQGHIFSALFCMNCIDLKKVLYT